MFFNTVYVTFLTAGACLSCSLSCITGQEICIIAVLVEESFTRLCSNAESKRTGVQTSSTLAKLCPLQHCLQDYWQNHMPIKYIIMTNVIAKLL